MAPCSNGTIEFAVSLAQRPPDLSDLPPFLTVSGLFRVGDPAKRAPAHAGKVAVRLLVWGRIALTDQHDFCRSLIECALTGSGGAA